MKDIGILKKPSMLVGVSVTSDVDLAQILVALCYFKFTIVPQLLVMSSDRLALFRRAFNRPAAGISMDSEDVPKPKINARRATAHWRQILDKVFNLQELIGLEESVNSWLPQASADLQPSRLSSKQLAEYVVTAEPMKPLQGKTSVSKTVAECQHAMDRLTMGGNQYGSWVICWDCHSRWRAPPGHVQEGKKTKAKAAAAPASSGEEFKTQAAKEKIAMEIRAEFEKEYQSQLRASKVESQKEVTVLKSELREAAKMAVLNDIMMSEYAEMSMGKTRYEEHKGYYDGEMFGIAERKLAFREEMRALTELQQACQEIPVEMTQGPMPMEESTATASTTTGVKKDQLKKERSHSPGRRRG